MRRRRTGRMPLVMVAEADAEMLDAGAFYEKKQKMLGSRFLASVQDAFTRIRINPLQYPVLHGDLRRCIVRIFPYGIVFRKEEKKDSSFVCDASASRPRILEGKRLKQQNTTDSNNHF